MHLSIAWYPDFIPELSTIQFLFVCQKGQWESLGTMLWYPGYITVAVSKAFPGEKPFPLKAIQCMPITSIQQFLGLYWPATEQYVIKTSHALHLTGDAHTAWA